jgi:hypothetical protein
MGMRNKPNLITLDVESALALMQEIYNDIVEQKNTASLIMKKMLTFMKDADDMSMIGPVIKEQQKILNECTEKKISLVKLQSVLFKQNSSSNKNMPMGKLNLSDEDRKILESLTNEIENPEGENYTL